MKDEKQCVVCGFGRGINNHHIIKRRIGGSDDKENLVFLCPNHHWIADFGDEKEKEEILELIKQFTGKSGKEISDEEKIVLDKKIKVLSEEFLCVFRTEKIIPFTNEEWERHKETWNYETTKKWLLGRGCSEIQCSLLHRRAEILILIKKLKEELKTTKI